METEALGFNPAPICMQKGCGEKSSARLTDGETRKDLCKQMALDMWRLYRKDGLEVLGAWNELTMDDFKMPEDEEQEMRDSVDLEHPWVEASFAGHPVPVPTQAKFEFVVVSTEGGKEEPAAMLTAITPSGIQTYYFEAQFFQEFLRSGAMVLVEIGEHLQKAQQGKIIIADKGMEQAVIAEQRIHTKIREGH